MCLIISPAPSAGCCLVYFPNANYPANATDVDRVMYLKTANYKFAADINLTNYSYYPMPIIGGNYSGSDDKPTITFDGDIASTSRLSGTKNNHSGLFTSIVPYDSQTPITIEGFNIAGTAAGNYYPGGLAAGYLIPNDSSRIGMPAITGGKLNISDIGLEELNVIGGTYESGSFTNGKALLIGYIDGGVHNINDIDISLPIGYSNHVEDDVIVGDDPIADALLGRVNGDSTLLEFQRVAFPPTYLGETVPNPDDQLHYFSKANFISQFDRGSAYYYYDSYSDLDSHAYIIDSNVTKASSGTQQIVINPPTARLDRGRGTAIAPFLIYSADQLYALAAVILSNGETLGTTATDSLQEINGFIIPAEGDTSR